MATWQIRDSKEIERENREKHGDQYETRLSVAKQKADDLDDGTKKGFEESCFMGAQFESVAMALSQEQFEVAKNWPARKWAKLVYNLANR